MAKRHTPISSHTPFSILNYFCLLLTTTIHPHLTFVLSGKLSTSSFTELQIASCQHHPLSLPYLGYWPPTSSTKSQSYISTNKLTPLPPQLFLFHLDPSSAPPFHYCYLTRNRQSAMSIVCLRYIVGYIFFYSPSVCLSILPSAPPVHPSVCPSVRPSVLLFVRPFTHPSVRQCVSSSFRPSVYMFARTSIRSYVPPSVCASVDPFIPPLVHHSVYSSMCASVGAYIDASVRSSINPSVRPSIRPSVCSSIHSLVCPSVR